MISNIILILGVGLTVILYLYIVIIYFINRGKEDSMTSSELVLKLLDNDASINLIESKESMFSKYNIKRKMVKLSESCYDSKNYFNLAIASLLSGYSLLNNNLDVDKGLSYYNEATSNTNIYSIALFHEPDSVDKILSKRNVNLLLAGHSHNGTIRLPYFGGIIKKAGAKKYNDSFYKLGDSEFYISSGLGTEGDGIRLFCKPSINFFRISNS